MFESLLSTTVKNSGGIVKPYRYYRMWITARNLVSAITVGEWELLDSNGFNQARGKPATASNQEFGNASGAFDGIVPANLGQPRWQTNTSTHPQWLQVDLQSAKEIVKFKLYCDSSQITNFADYSPKDWIFQGSLDNATWENIISVTNQTTAVWKTKREHEWNVV